MPNIEDIVRQINREFLPQFEERLRFLDHKHLSSQDLF